MADPVTAATKRKSAATTAGKQAKARGGPQSKRGRKSTQSMVACGADNDELKQCFLWELAQALKEHYLNAGVYNSRNKVTFSCDYSERIPIQELRHLAWTEFAPPIQRLCAVLALRLTPRLPAGPMSLILDHLFPGFITLAGVLEGFDAFCLGAPCVASGKLTIRLPKDERTKSKKPLVNPLVHRFKHGALAGVQESHTWLHESLSCGWWATCFHPDQRIGARHRAWGGLEHRIMSAEAAVPGGAPQVSRLVGLPAVVPFAHEPHSLLLVFKVCDGGSKWNHATMVVPHDLAVTELFGWVGKHLNGRLGLDLSSYQYLRVTDSKKKMDWVQDREKNESLALEEIEAMQLHSLTVRVWSIEDDCRGKPYDSDLECAAESKPFASCQVLGSREAVLKKAAEWALEGRAGGDIENGSRVDMGHVDVMFECAVADVLPTVEELLPSLEAYRKDILVHLMRAGAELEWNHSRATFECFAAQRLPRLPDEAYPVVKITSKVPYGFF